MNYLIDTHCHLHDRETYNFALSRNHKADPADFDPEKILARARAAGVLQLICIGTTHEDSLRAAEFAAGHDDVFWTYGVHPDEANRAGGPVAASSPTGSSLTLRAVGAPQAAPPSSREGLNKLVAIGEVGLDYRNGTCERAVQIRLFEEMLQLAQDHDLPLVFHVREAFDDFFAALRNFPTIAAASEPRAVVHSFSDGPENLQKSLDHNFYIGVNGLATFADIPIPPLEKILLETDAPFLTPTPNRGKINESAYIKDIARYLANKLGVTDAEIAKITTHSARKLFQLPDPVVRPAHEL